MFQPIVETLCGKLKGKVEHGVKGQKYCSFLGIPYAEPPVSDLRFKDPVPRKPWNGIRDAIKDGQPSVQENMQGQLIGSEDCLFLNVFTPNLPIGTKVNEKLLKPVMVFLHGGYLLVGSNKSKIFGPQFLMTKDVVLITVNYRLGLLGFLNCEDEELGITGNASFKDMVLALKWVKNNIIKFNGDPNNITLFGQSSGAVCVQLMLFSPLAQGLFHKAIMQSCSIFIPATYTDSLKAFADAFGFHGKTEKEIVQYLTTCPVEDILKLQTTIELKFPNGNRKRFIGLTIEKPGPNAFITHHPLDALRLGAYAHIPLMMGYNSNEGVILEIVMQKNNTALDMFWTDTELLIPHYWNAEEASPRSLMMGRKIIDHYFPKARPINEHREGARKLHNDFFTWCLLKGAAMHSHKCPTYLYKNDVYTKLNIFKNLMDIDSPGTFHGDELGYIFHTNFFTPEIEDGSNEDITQRRFLTLWTNFARYGNPTPSKEPLIDIQWKPTNSEDLPYLEIGNDLVLKSNPDPDWVEFWQKLELVATYFTSKL